MPQRSFLYTDVATTLRARIATGVYPSETCIPSIRELIDEFQVSAITIRRAMGELMHEGLVQGHQGIGVFVKGRPKIHRVLAGDPDNSVGDEIARAGFKPRLAEIEYSQIKANDVIASRLGVPSGTNIFRHQKMTYANEEPVALHILHMRSKLARSLREELGKAFIFRLLNERKIPIGTLKCEFSSVVLSEQYARLFNLQPGNPMLQVDYTPIGEDGAPVLLGQTICCADRFVFEVNLPRRRRLRKAPTFD
jgi:DNA-binding GntR family transcriptional regulator